MGIDVVLAVLAVGAFFLSAIGRDDGKGVPVGLMFLTLLIAF